MDCREIVADELACRQPNRDSSDDVVRSGSEAIQWLKAEYSRYSGRGNVVACCDGGGTVLDWCEYKCGV